MAEYRSAVSCVCVARGSNAAIAPKPRNDAETGSDEKQMCPISSDARKASAVSYNEVIMSSSICKTKLREGNSRREADEGKV